jgi:hypothetical protein
MISAINPNLEMDRTFGGILLFFKNLPSTDKSIFFSNSLPKMIKMILDTPNAFPTKIPLLLQDGEKICISKF